MRVSILDPDGINMELVGCPEDKTFIKHKDFMTVAAGCNNDSFYLKFMNNNVRNWKLKINEDRGVIEFQLSDKAIMQEFINSLELAIDVLKEMRE